MMLRIQRERQGANYFPCVEEYAQTSVSPRTRALREGRTSIIMHPGPLNRGLEIAHDRRRRPVPA